MNEAQLTTLAKEIIKRKDANSHVMISEDKPKEHAFIWTTIN